MEKLSCTKSHVPAKITVILQFPINSSPQVDVPSKVHQPLCIPNSTMGYRTHTTVNPICASPQCGIGHPANKGSSTLPAGCWYRILNYKHHAVCMKKFA